MLIKKSIKLTTKKISGLITAAIILVTLAALIFISSFLYKNFYQTITQAKEIIILREKVAINKVNLEKFNIIIDKLTKKTAPRELGNVISPFR